MSDERKQHCITVCCDCGCTDSRSDVCCGGVSRTDVVEKLSEIVEQLKQMK